MIGDTAVKSDPTRGGAWGNRPATSARGYYDQILIAAVRVDFDPDEDSTLGCAECHAHEFDPISHREFDQLYAFFNSVEDKQVGKAPTLVSTAKPRETRIHLRGDFRHPGDRGPR